MPPPTLGIRVIGVNMIHGVPDKLNIYVKRVLEGSVAGLDGRIKVNDHIVEVRACLYHNMGVIFLSPLDPDLHVQGGLGFGRAKSARIHAFPDLKQW